MTAPITPPDRPRLPWDPPDHFEKRIPDGDNRERLVCARCEFIHYQNPKIVAGAVCTWNDRILLAKRAIEPRKGFWTLPAGYMELGETTEQAAQREAREEACATIEIDRLLAMYSVARIGQVQIMYRARLVSGDVAAGPESEEVAECATLVWNGPLGAFEIKPFDAGTVALARTVADLTSSGKLLSVAGGGDTVAALAAAGVEEKFSYVSAAGGAFLEWMEGKALPGVAALIRAA